MPVRSPSAQNRPGARQRARRRRKRMLAILACCAAMSITAAVVHYGISGGTVTAHAASGGVRGGHALSASPAKGLFGRSAGQRAAQGVAAGNASFIEAP